VAEAWITQLAWRKSEDLRNLRIAQVLFENRRVSLEPEIATGEPARTLDCDAVMRYGEICAVEFHGNCAGVVFRPFFNEFEKCQRFYPVRSRSEAFACDGRWPGADRIETN
jgi:hypothetical protein